MNNLTKEYECPNCGEYIDVAEDTKRIQCPECELWLTVSRDSEVVDGKWRDLTKLLRDEP